MSESLRDQLEHIARNHDESARDIEDDACFHRGIAEGIRRAMSIISQDESTDVRFAPCPDCGAGYDASGCDFACPSRWENERDIREVFPDLPMTPTDLLVPADETPQEFHSPHPETGGDA
jgi:hypothetical protein